MVFSFGEISVVPSCRTRRWLKYYHRKLREINLVVRAEERRHTPKALPTRQDTLSLRIPLNLPPVPL
jgi:hypothetical protein